MAKFKVTNQPFYSQGTLHPVGTVVELPDDHKAPAHWTPVDEDGEPAPEFLEQDIDQGETPETELEQPKAEQSKKGNKPKRSR